MSIMKRIYVSVPPGDLAEAVVSRAAALAKVTGASVRLATCVYDPYIAGERFADSPELESARGDLVSDRQSALDAMAAALSDQGIDCDGEAFWGYPVHKPLTAHAVAWGADLVIVVTDHTDFDYEMISRHATLILDTRNATRNIA